MRSDKDFQSDVNFSITRDEIIGHPTQYRVSNLGVIQFKHDYDTALIESIASAAKHIKQSAAEKRHLNLNYIREAHRHIPEISQLIRSPERQQRISELAGVRLEPYPISVISSIITFQDAAQDGSIVWHADGIPVTEMIPLEIDNLSGGELEVYQGDYEEGLAQGQPNATDTDVIQVSHRYGYSILGQLMRTAHRVSPIKTGSRITLNLNWRSVAYPWIDDNTITYLAADNPELDWLDEYMRDVREVHIPAYTKHQQ